MERETSLSAAVGGPAGLILGFDIGSTGSKLVALECERREAIWEGYVSTNGQPVAAAQALMAQFVASEAGAFPVVAFGATGSGREIVGSLLATCYGADGVYVLNEIVAHAEGALHYDPRVDTIFEIGGQDAKYARLAHGRVVDAAMNEACSAGTGSFIEEQGGKFSSIENVVQLGQAALRADCGVSLGQHCSVFMAEVIDEAVAAGVAEGSIIAGIYDSITQNYLNRVKGCRSVGEVIFCQGMPFAADALAAAVARQTGSQVVVPPSPGTVGALGIALLARKNLDWENLPARDPQRFLNAEVARKDTFVCKSNKFCGGAGNRCRIDRITTVVDAQKQRFTWGGNCSLWDGGTGRAKLPDKAPDPFRAREEMSQELVERLTQHGAGPRVALSDEFMLKGLFPFFATFLHELGLELAIGNRAGQQTLKRGIEEANVPFCAPMQLYQGLVSGMAEHKPDYIFLPMLREVPRVGSENHSVVCPIAQASPDLLRWTLGDQDVQQARLTGGGYRRGVARLTEVPRQLPLGGAGIRRERRDLAQRIRARTLRAVGLRGALRWNWDERRCASLEERGIMTVVVLGRPYTIYNKVLNSNVPAILREQGALAIPVDCYPVSADTPLIDGVYWGYSQRNLRAAWQARRTPGVYTLWCSNYSCGPDSFNLHFYGDLMRGKPYAVIETDGHSGTPAPKPAWRLSCTASRRTSRPIPDPTHRPPFGPTGSAWLTFATTASMCSSLVWVRTARRWPLCCVGPEWRPRCSLCRTGKARVSGVAIPPGRNACRCASPSAASCNAWSRSAIAMRASPSSWRVRTAPAAWAVTAFCTRPCSSASAGPSASASGRPTTRNTSKDLTPGLSALAVTGIAAIDMLLEGLYDTRPRECQRGAAQSIYDDCERALVRHIEAVDQSRG